MAAAWKYKKLNVVMPRIVRSYRGPRIPLTIYEHHLCIRSGNEICQLVVKRFVKLKFLRRQENFLKISVSALYSKQVFKWLTIISIITHLLSCLYKERSICIPALEIVRTNGFYKKVKHLFICCCLGIRNCRGLSSPLPKSKCEFQRAIIIKLRY